MTPREKAEELLHLVGGGVPVEHALPRVGWTAQAAYRWEQLNAARRSCTTHLLNTDRIHQQQKEK